MSRDEVKWPAYTGVCPMCGHAEELHDPEFGECRVVIEREDGNDRPCECVKLGVGWIEGC